MAESTNPGLIILSHTADNIKRLTAVALNPESGVVTIGGENGHGKTSLLDSIEWALGGKPDAPMPIRAGETKARIVTELGDDGGTKLIVKRSFTCDENGKVNSYLDVSTPDGATYKSPQAVLDKLLGDIALDPLEFMRKKEKDKLDTMLECFNLDFSDLTEKRKAAFDERTIVNRSLAELEAKFKGMPSFPDAPSEEVSIAKLSEDLNAVTAHNQVISTAESTYQQKAFALGSDQTRHEEMLKAIKALEEELEAKKKRATEFGEALVPRKAEVDTLKAELNAMVLQDPAPIQAQIASAEETNTQVRANKAKSEGRLAWEAAEARRVELAKTIEACDAEKTKRLSEAKLPVEGLGFDDTQILFNGVPLQQASGAEQIKVAAAIALAQNPRLKVLLVRDGSLLDGKSMTALTQMATENGAQVWVERVASKDEASAVSVFIEDGEVYGVQPKLEVIDGDGEPITKEEHAAGLFGGGQ